MRREEMKGDERKMKGDEYEDTSVERRVKQI